MPSNQTKNVPAFVGGPNSTKYGTGVFGLDNGTNDNLMESDNTYAFGTNHPMRKTTTATSSAYKKIPINRSSMIAVKKVTQDLKEETMNRI